MKQTLTGKALQSDLLKAVDEKSGQNVTACYQCGKCSGGCPVLADLKLSPNRIMRMVQLGLEDAALNNETIWCCVGCGTCSSRCPIGIDIVAVMDALRSIAERKGIKPPGDGAAVWTFFRSFLDCVQEFGRLSEVGLMGSYNVNSGYLLTNVIKAPWFVLRGKIGLSPHKIKQIDRLQRVFKRIEEAEGK